MDETRTSTEHDPWHDRVDDSIPDCPPDADDLIDVVNDALAMAVSAARIGWDIARRAAADALRDVPEAQPYLRRHDRPSRWTRHYASDAAPPSGWKEQQS